MNAQPYFGWYSQEAARKYGTVIYVKDGVFTECTVVAKDPNFQYELRDAVFLGEVGDYSHKGRVGTEELVKKVELESPHDFSYLPFKSDMNIRNSPELQAIIASFYDMLSKRLQTPLHVADSCEAVVPNKREGEVEEEDKPTVLTVGSDGETFVVS